MENRENGMDGNISQQIAVGRWGPKYRMQSGQDAPSFFYNI